MSDNFTEQEIELAIKAGSFDADTQAIAIRAMRLASQQEVAQDFDAWQNNPYTKVLQKSIAEDYVPKSDKAQEVAAPVVTGCVYCRKGSGCYKHDDTDQPPVLIVAPGLPLEMLYTLSAFEVPAGRYTLYITPATTQGPAADVKDTPK